MATLTRTPMTDAQKDDAIEVVGMAHKRLVDAQLAAAQAEDDYRARRIEAQDMVEAQTAEDAAKGFLAGMLLFMDRVYGFALSKNISATVEKRG